MTSSIRQISYKYVVFGLFFFLEITACSLVVTMWRWGHRTHAVLPWRVTSQPTPSPRDKSAAGHMVKVP